MIKKVQPILTIMLVTLLLGSCTLDKVDLVDPEKSDSYFNPSGNNFVFSRNGNVFELGKYEFEADQKTFKVLNSYIAKDKDYVYFEGHKQIPLSEKGESIKHNGWFLEQPIDHNSFEVIPDHPILSKDKNHLYDYGSLTLKIIEGDFDLATIRGVKFPISTLWTVDKNHYYINHKKIEVDKNTFEFLNRNFAKDAFALYHVWQSGIDTIKLGPTHPKLLTDNYLLESDTLFYLNPLGKPQILKSKVDKNGTIQVIDNCMVSIGSQVFHRGIEFSSRDVDVETLSSFGNCSWHHKDKNHVYFLGKIIKGADPRTIKTLSNRYAKDKDNVYYETDILEGVDPKNFNESDTYH